MSGEPATLRFAVLHHHNVPSPHFDWLLETAPVSPLLTFRCPQWPLQPGDLLTPQPDHRPIYLDYEGEISGKRGTVTRILAGHCHIERQPDGHLDIHLIWPQGSARIQLIPQDAIWLVQSV